MTCLARNCNAHRNHNTFLCVRHWVGLPADIRERAQRLVSAGPVGRSALASLVFNHYWFCVLFLFVAMTAGAAVGPSQPGTISSYARTNFPPAGTLFEVSVPTGTNSAGRTNYVTRSINITNIFDASSLFSATPANSTNGFATLETVYNASNAVVALIPSTNGFVGSSITNGFATHGTVNNASNVLYDLIASSSSGSAISNLNGLGTNLQLMATGTNIPLRVYGDVNMSSNSVLRLDGAVMIQGNVASNNMFFGGSGNLTTIGTGNTGAGVANLNRVTSGYSNTSIGYNSGYAIENGRENTAIGAAALNANVSADWNVAIGVQALYRTVGANNVGIGVNAAAGNTSGIDNIGIGVACLLSNTTGSGNIAIGSIAGYEMNNVLNNGSGYNTVIGYGTGRGITTGTNNTIIGARVTGLPPTLANTVIIADGAGNHKLYANSAGNVGIGTTNPVARLTVTPVPGATNNWFQLNDTNGTATIYVKTNGQLVIPDGSAAIPSLKFAGAADGLYSIPSGNGVIGFSIGGGSAALLSDSIFWLTSDSIPLALGAAADVTLSRAAAGIAGLTYGLRLTPLTGSTNNTFQINTTNGAPSLFVQSNGVTVLPAPVRLKGYAVASLPTGTIGDTAYVTDAITPVWNTPVTNGGAVVVPVFYNGVNWIVH